MLTIAFDLKIHRSEQVAFPEFTKAVSTALSKVDTSTVRLATTEAGLIPLTIEGPSLDAYGWNDYSIARSGGSTLEARLMEFSPNLIIMHGLPPSGTVSYSCTKNYFTPEWNAMTGVIANYASRNDFELLRSTLTARCDAWTIYISKVTSSAIRRQLSQFVIQGVELISGRFNQ